MTDSTLPATLDPQAWIVATRADMLTTAGFTATDLHRAVKRNRKLLKARKVKHVVVNGDLQALESDDNDAQLRAVDMIYDLAGVKAPKAQSTTQSAGVEVVIDPSSGQVIVRAITK